MSTPSPYASAVCPSCHVEGPVRLDPGQVCDACRAEGAWSRWAAEGKLVIGRADIEEAVRRREGEAAGEPWWKKLAPVLPSLPSLALGVLALATLRGLLAARPIGPPAELVVAIGRASRLATLAGALAVTVAAFPLAWLRRRRQFRR